MLGTTAFEYTLVRWTGAVEGAVEERVWVEEEGVA